MKYSKRGRLREFTGMFKYMCIKFNIFDCEFYGVFYCLNFPRCQLTGKLLVQLQQQRVLLNFLHCSLANY